MPGRRPHGDGDQYGAVDVPVEPGEDPEQRGLAATAAAEEGDELTRRQVEMEVIDDGTAVEGAGQPLDMDGLGDPGGRGAHRPVNVGRHRSNSLSRERTMKSARRPRKA